MLERDILVGYIAGPNAAAHARGHRHAVGKAPGMPMTSSMGCGVWAGNITNENISLKHYLNYTWVARPIAEDKPSDEELFGEFYNTETW